MADAIDRAQKLDQCKTAMTPDRFLEEGGPFAREYKECIDNNIRFGGTTQSEAEEYCKPVYEQGQKEYCEKQVELNNNIQVIKPTPTPTPPPAENDPTYLQRREEAKSQETQAAASEETLKKKQEEIDAQKEAAPPTSPVPTATPAVVQPTTASTSEAVAVPSILPKVNGMEISCISRQQGARPALNAARKCMIDEGKKLGYVPTSQPFDYTSELKEQDENYYWEVVGMGMFKKATPEEASPTAECQQLRDLQEEIKVLENNLTKLEAEKKDLDAQAVTNPKFAKIAREIDQNLDPDAETTEERNFKFDYFDITRQIKNLKAGTFSIPKKKEQAEELKPKCNQAASTEAAATSPEARGQAPASAPQAVAADTGSAATAPSSDSSSKPSVLYKVNSVDDVLTPEELARYEMTKQTKLNAQIELATYQSNTKLTYSINYPEEATSKQSAIELITQRIKTQGIAGRPPQPNFVYPGVLEPRPDRPPPAVSQVIQPAASGPCTELEQVNTQLEEVKKVRDDATNKREAIEDADATETRKTEYDQLTAIEQRETNRLLPLLRRKQILEAECKQAPTTEARAQAPESNLTPAQRYDKQLTDTISNTGIPVQTDIISVENNTITTTAIRLTSNGAAIAADTLNTRQAFRKNLDESKPRDKTATNEVLSSPTQQNPRREVYKTTVKATYDSKSTPAPSPQPSQPVEVEKPAPVTPAVAPQREQPPMENAKMQQRQQVAQTREGAQNQRTSETQANNTRAATTNSYPVEYTPGPVSKPKPAVPQPSSAAPLPKQPAPTPPRPSPSPTPSPIPRAQPTGPSGGGSTQNQVFTTGANSFGETIDAIKKRWPSVVISQGCRRVNTKSAQGGDSCTPNDQIIPQNAHDLMATVLLQGKKLQLFSGAAFAFRVRTIIDIMKRKGTSDSQIKNILLNQLTLIEPFMGQSENNAGITNITATEALIKEGYINPRKIMVGAHNGVGAVLATRNPNIGIRRSSEFVRSGSHIEASAVILP